jgi:hypothetical protein
MFRQKPPGIHKSNWDKAERVRLMAEAVIEANTLKEFKPQDDEVEVYENYFDNKIVGTCYAYTRNNYRIGISDRLVSSYYVLKRNSRYNSYPSQLYRYFSKNTDLHYAGKYLRSERWGSPEGNFGKDIFFHNGKEVEIESSNTLCYKEVPCQSSVEAKGGKRRPKSKRKRYTRRKATRKC